MNPIKLLKSMYPSLHASIVSIPGLSPTAQLWAGKLPNFDFNAYPGPVFHSHAIPIRIKFPKIMWSGSASVVEVEP